MNAVYKLIFNVSTGTWAVASELTASRGKKNRTRLASAMAVALTLPAGAAMAADSPDALQCDINETASADGKRCIATGGSLSLMSGGIGVMAGTDAYEAGGGNASAIRSVAIGTGAAAGNQNAVAVGFGAGRGAGSLNVTDGVFLGYGATTGTIGTDFTGVVAIGSRAQASGVASVVIGQNSSNQGSSSVVIGANASAVRGLAAGANANASGNLSTALGSSASATGDNSVALGRLSVANRGNAVSVGSNAATGGFTRQITNVSAGTVANDAVNLGQMNTALSSKLDNQYVNFSTGGDAGTLGRAAVGALGGDIAMGIRASATGGRATAIGESSVASGIHSIAIGSSSTPALGAHATSQGAIALGTESDVNAEMSAALGYNADVATGASNSVALGSNSTATQQNTVSVGNTTANGQRRIVNMAAGTANTDAVNIAQLKPVVDALGGGATIDTTTGAVTGPTYNIGGADRSTVGEALTNLDGRLKDSGLSDDDGSTMAAVTYDRNADRTTNYGRVTFGNGNGAVQLKNVAAGTAGTDAVNLDQLNTAVANVPPAANPYIGGIGTGVAAAATGQGSVALGLGSVATGLNTVSMGNATSGLVRRITNVADGSDRSDAATVGQLNDLVVGTTMTTQNSIKEVNSKIAALSSMGAMAAVDDAYLKIDASEGSPQATVGADTSAVAIGSGATATGSFSAAIGGAASATGNQAVAIGGDAHATAAGALAMGRADATGNSAVALGDGTRASGNNSVASGHNAHATATNAIASGNTTRAEADNAIAIGATATVNAGATNSVALGRGSSVGATATNAVALGANSSATRANTVSVGTATANRQIVNVGAGSQDTDAVNVSQLKGIASAIGGGAAVGADGTITAPTFNIGGTDFDNVGEALDNIDTRTTANTGAITTINTNVTNLQGDVTNLLDGTAGLVQYDATANTNAGGVTVAKDLAGTTVDFTGKGTDDAPIQRRLLGVAAGTADTDAANVGQLKGTAQSVATALGGNSTVNPDGTVTAPSYSVGGTAHRSVGLAIDAIDTSLTGTKGDVTNLTTIVNNLSEGEAGLVQYDATANTNAGGVTVAKDLAGTTVDFSGKNAQNLAIQRRLLGVAAGTADTDAANVGQLKGTAQSVATALGGNSTVNADGTVTAPSYSVGGTAHRSVGLAIEAIDTSLTGTKGDVTNLTTIVNNLSGGTTGLVQYDATANANAGGLTVAKDLAGTTVDFSGKNAQDVAIQRRLLGVAAGTADTDAANIGQVKGIAGVIGGGTAVAADGSITAPTFNVGDTDVHTVAEALSNIDGRTKTNAESITTINTNVTNLQGDVTNLLDGTAGLVQYDATANANAGGVTVAKDLPGTTVGFAGVNDGVTVNRRLTGVAAGTADTDAVNVGQLNARVANPYFAGLGGGAAAVAESDSSVALGIRSLARGLNTVSVGNADTGLVRRITNVADGQDDNDAATIGQVNDLVVGVTTTTTNALNEFNNKISSMGAGTLAAVDDAYLKIDASAGSAEATVGADTSAVAIGSGANATGAFSAAIGASAQATGTQAVAIGGDASATANGALAMGRAQASAVSAVALGDGTRATGNTAVAAGFNAHATGTNALAVGNTARAASVNAIAIGATATVDGAATGSMALGRGANVSAAASNSVALGAGSVADAANTISVGSATAQRRITNVAEGTQGTDAVNFSQLQRYVQDNGGGTGNALAVSYTNTDRDSITLGNTDAETGTKISNVAAGAVSTTSSDAINGKQLFDTATSVATALGGGATVGADGVISAPTYTVGDTAHHNVGTAIGAINTSITNLTNGTAGLVQYDATANANAGGLTVGKDVAGTTVDFSGTSQGATVSRRLTGVAAGIADTNAVNVLQLKGIADAIGGGAAVGTDGTITAPSFSIGGTTYNNVGQALTNIDGRTTTNTTNIQNLTTRVDQIGEGGAADPLAVAYTNTDKDEIALAGEEGTTISNVKAGAVSATSMDAINGAQLHGTATSVATALGGGSVVNADGTVSAPSYTIGAGDYTNVGDAFDAVDTSLTGLGDRLTVTEGDVTNLNTIVNNLSNGTAGLVTIDPTTSNVQVAKDVGGTVVDMEGTDGKRRVSGVANGTQADDAVTIAQLRAAGAIDPVSGQTLSVLTYDGDDLARATLGGTNGTVIANLGNGLVAAGSREAINGGQLFEVKADWEARFNGLDGRVGTIEQGISDGTIGSGGGSGGGDSGLVGPGAGDRSVVIGEGSTATGNDSVAIGSGSTADRDREVSVGAAGNERVVSNVATGTRPTDAVNVQQMEDRFTAERDWTNGRFQAVDKRIDRMGAISAAYAGMAINTAGLEGEHRVGAGIGQQNGRSALAVGYQRVLGEKKNISVSLGGAFSGSDKSMSAGAGFSW